MKKNKCVQTFFSLAALFCFSSAKASEESCEVYGQYVAYISKADDSTKIGVCRSSIAGGLSYVNNTFDAKDLARVLTANKNNREFVSALNSLNIGSDYSSALKAIVDYGGALTIEGDVSDIKRLDYIASQMNKVDGITDTIAKRKKQDAADRTARSDRAKTPVDVSLDKFKKMTEQNRSVGGTLTETTCRSDSQNSPEKKIAGHESEVCRRRRDFCDAI